MEPASTGSDYGGHAHISMSALPPYPLDLQEYRECCYTSDVFKSVAWGQTHGLSKDRGGGGGGGEREI